MPGVRNNKNSTFPLPPENPTPPFLLDATIFFLYDYKKDSRQLKYNIPATLRKPEGVVCREIH